jgi:hypothetical protein
MLKSFTLGIFLIWCALLLMAWFGFVRPMQQRIERKLVQPVGVLHAS